MISKRFIIWNLSFLSFKEFTQHFPTFHFRIFSHQHLCLNAFFMAGDFPEWQQSMNFDNNNAKEEER